MTDPDAFLRWQEGGRLDASRPGGCSDRARLPRVRSPSLSGAAYHCQQAAEKLLKGLLVQAGTDFRRTHDLGALVGAVLLHFPALESLLTVMGAWAAWGTAYRYPSEDEPEPEPDGNELLGAIDTIAQLDRALRSVAPAKPDQGTP